MDFVEFWKLIRFFFSSGEMIGFAALSGMCSLSWSYFAHRTRISLAAYRVVSIFFTTPTLLFLALGLIGETPDAFLRITGVVGIIFFALGVWFGSAALGWLAGYVVGLAMNLLVPHEEASDVHPDQ
jgi:hypothetical protein